MKILTATIFTFAIMVVFASAEAQERAKFPVSVSSKTLGYGPLWAVCESGKVCGPELFERSVTR